MDQSTHDVRRNNWFHIVSECQNRPAGVTVLQWLEENDVKEKAYYYWLRKFRKEAYEQMQMSTVQTTSTEVTFTELSFPTRPNILSEEQISVQPAVIIRQNAFTIEISNGISEELLSRIIREVSHA